MPLQGNLSENTKRFAGTASARTPRYSSCWRATMS